MTLQKVLATALTLALGFATNAWAETIIFAPPGADYTFAGDIDSAGRVAGHFTDATGRHGFIYDGSGYTIINLPGALATFIEGMNDLGDLAGFFNDGSYQNKGFLMTAASLTVIDVPGSRETQAHDVNDNGVVVGYFSDQAGHAHSFIYEGGSITQLDYPGAVSTAARSINNNGVIVGSYTDAANVSHGFIFDGASFTNFDPPGSVLTDLESVNNLGHLAGWYRVIVKKNVAKTIAFTYDGTTYTTIDIPNFTENSVNGINDNDEVTGDGYVAGQQGTKGFLIRAAGSHPDLAVTAVSGPTGARRGEYITVTTTVVNQGTASSGSFDLGIYLSTDATITTGDLKRATVSVADMALGESRTFNTDFLIQGSTAPGNYYLGAIADEANVVVESNEFNNAKAGNTIRIR